MFRERRFALLGRACVFAFALLAAAGSIGCGGETKEAAPTGGQAVMPADAAGDSKAMNDFMKAQGKAK